MVTTTKLPPSVQKAIYNQSAKNTTTNIKISSVAQPTTQSTSGTTGSSKINTTSNTPTTAVTSSTTSTAKISTPTTQPATKGFAAVGNVLNPFANNPISLRNPFDTSQVIVEDVGAPVRALIRTGEGALAGAGAIALWTSSAVGTAVAGTTAAVGGVSSNLFKNVGAGLLGAGAGYIAGSLRSTPTTQTQQQTPTQTTTTTTSSKQFTYAPSTQIDKSIRTQYTYNIVENSPYGAIGGSAYMGGNTQTPTISPYQSTPVSVEPTQSAAQQQSASSTNWALVAGIIAAGLIFSKR